MMTANEIRQSFCDFFKEQSHTYVPSSSLIPDNPALPQFINAGMNQFVPFFLGEQVPPFSPARAANSQKCIRAGGKHNDLEDVGMDTYHHTYFEMLGNWSFGDYFKEEAIQWAWTLLTERWGFPKERLYFTVYAPGEGEPGEPDAEAHGIWSRTCRENGLDPDVHVIYCGKADNFWMMGDTGPCGPCSEVHIDLTPEGDSKGALVNADDHRCIEIWNLVFIQNNATPDGRFEDLPACHVDTGMGFERACAAIQSTKNFTDFSKPVSNYDTDVFAGLFGALSELCGHSYHATLPSAEMDETQTRDIAFRVIADHIRCLTAAISDGVTPHRDGRGYVLRRILRRAVRYGRSLDLTGPFLHKLVAVVADELGDVFPNMRENQAKVTELVLQEEVNFGRTLDRGLRLFDDVKKQVEAAGERTISGKDAFKLYATYGFPLDLTQLMAREAGLSVDVPGFDKEMKKHIELGQAGRRNAVIEVIGDGLELTPTTFTGFDTLTESATVQQVITLDEQIGVVLDRTPFYAEKGGQIGDTGVLKGEKGDFGVVDTQVIQDANLHVLADAEHAVQEGDQVDVTVDAERRRAIERHHTVTHLLHWALQEVLGADANQRGSYVGDRYLRFDFSQSGAMTDDQVRTVERLVNERIIENAEVHCFERARTDIEARGDINQFFGDKYGDTVRIVQIGGDAGSLDGYSMELCGGTHTPCTGVIGPFMLRQETAVAAGIRRIEAIAGHPALAAMQGQLAVLNAISGRLTTPIAELEDRLGTLLDNQKRLEKELKAMAKKVAEASIDGLLQQLQTVNDVPVLVADVSAQDSSPRDILELVLQKVDRGIVVLGSNRGGKCAFVCSVSKDLTADGWNAGKIARQVAQIAGGGGGGGAEKAQAGGPAADKLNDALSAVSGMVEQGA